LIPGYRFIVERLALFKEDTVMTTGIGHLALTTKNMEKSAKFYTEALGFKKVFSLPEPGTGSPWIEYFMAGEQFVELFYHGSVDNPWKDDIRGFNHICLEVDDIYAAAKQVEAAGFKMDRQPVEGSDKNWQAWLTDPDGVRIELMQISPESPQGKLKAGKSI
jgi:catechol 2,3-dioxygenase-like lactoylglutathione lyase family enzyme